MEKYRYSVMHIPSTILALNELSLEEVLDWQGKSGWRLAHILKDEYLIFEKGT